MSMLPCVDEISCLNLHPLKSGPPTLPLVQREFRRNEGSTDYATIPEVTLSGSIVVEFDMLTSKNAIQYIFDNSVNSERVYAYYDNGASEIKTSLTSASISVDGGGNTITHDGLLHHVVITGNASGKIVNLMTNNAATFKLQGILANLKIWDNGELIRNYPINDGRSILANAATALGSEIDGLTYALTTAIGGVASVVLSSLSVIGKTYLVEVSYSGVVGDASVRIGGFSGPSFTGTGSHSFVATAITTVNDILGALTGVTSGSVTVSIKEAVGYGTIINGNADDWGLFDKTATGWKGVGLAVPPWDSVDQVLVVA